MARRKQAPVELLLVPFLDILCSLIGVLILIITVLAVAQSQKVAGRDPAEVERAIEAKKLREQLEKQKPIAALLKERLAVLDDLKQRIEEAEQKLAKMRKLISSADEQRSMSQKLAKELDNLLLELDGYKKKQLELKKEVAALTAELKERQLAPTRPPAVVVQPGGSGLAEGAKLFFVEVSAGKLTIHWNPEQRTVVVATDEIIVADVAYNFLLKEVQKQKDAKLIFLLRDDGMAAYNKALGWAQATYALTPERTGKLPLPGRGEIDLKQFKQYLGTLTPPPEAKLMPAPAAPKPATPKA